MSKLVGNNEAAELLDMSPAAFAKGARQGRFAAASHDKKGKPLYDTKQIYEQYKATEPMAAVQDGSALLPPSLKGGRPSASGSPTDAEMGDNAKSYLKAKTMNETLKARMQKLKYETQSGKLIDKEIAEKQGAELGSVLMGILDSWAPRLAPEFASMKEADEHDFHLKISREVNILKQEIIGKCHSAEK